MSEFPLTDINCVLWLLGTLTPSVPLVFVDQEMVESVFNGQLAGSYIGYGTAGNIGDRSWIWVQRYDSAYRVAKIPGGADVPVCTLLFVTSNLEISAFVVDPGLALSDKHPRLVVRSDIRTDQVVLDVTLQIDDSPVAEPIEGLMVCTIRKDSHPRR